MNQNPSNKPQHSGYQGTTDPQNASYQQPSPKGFGKTTQIPASVQKYVKGLSKDEIATLSKAGKDMFLNSFSDSATTFTFKEILDKLKASGQKYEDLEFPANLHSLTGGLNEVELEAINKNLKWKKIIWLRPKEIFGEGNYKLFKDNIEPHDIRQGELGDCYFLTTLASMAEKPNRIRKLFETDEVNEQGIYSIKICDMGEWKSIIVDDLIPCSVAEEPIFTRSNGSEIWVMLLEKAWAKLYGGYARINAGLTRESLHDLTGGPTKFHITDDFKKYDQVWKEILEGEQKNFIMTCGSGDYFQGASLLSSVGLVGTHAYALLSALEIKDKIGNTVKLVKLRNPWGASEWVGDWADSSPLWSPELIKQVGLENMDEGIFFMSFKDFGKYFNDIQICRVHENYNYNVIRASCNHQHAAYFKMVVKEKGHYYLTANQEGKRKYLPSEGYSYSEIAIVAGRKEENGYEYIEGFQRSDKEVSIEGELVPGEYTVYVKIDWLQEKEREFTLAVYGPSDVTVEKVPKSYCPEFISQVYISKARPSEKLLDYSKYNVNQCYRAVNLTDDGFGFIYYKNGSHFTLEEELYFEIFEGLQFRKPYRGNAIKVLVKPGEEKIAITKVLPDAKKIKLSFKEIVRFI